MPYPDNYVWHGAPDDGPRYDADAPEPITAAEAAQFEAAAKPYRAILAALRQVSDDARRICTPEMIGLVHSLQDAINDCTPLAAIQSWDDTSDDDGFSYRQSFDQMMDEVK